MRTSRFLFALGPVLALGCTHASTEPVDNAAADLSSSPFGDVCSEPVRSADGAFVALDLCPKGGAAGRLVRVTLSDGTQTEVASYPPADRIESLGAAGEHLFFGVRHAVDALGHATQGIDVSVHAWSLSAKRTLRAGAETAAAEQGGLETLILSADGSRVAFALAPPGNAEAQRAKRLYVADLAGDAPAAALELGAAPDGVRFSTAGATFVAHVADPAAGTGETLLVAEKDAASFSAPRHVGWTSALYGQGGTRLQEPFDGARILGSRVATEGSQIGTVDPRTGDETVLETAPLLTLVTDLGSDVFYSRVTEVEGAFARALVRQPRAGGEKTTVLVATAPTQEELRFGFEPLALTKTGAFGVFATRTGTGPTERWIAKLDGSVPGDKLGPKVKLVDQLGDRVLLLDTTTPGAALLQVLDLATGTKTDLGPSGGATASATLLGDGSAVELRSCTTADGSFGQSMRQLGGEASAPLACAWMPWASIGLTAPGSNAVVFYSSEGTFPNYRYAVGIVKP